MIPGVALYGSDLTVSVAQIVPTNQHGLIEITVTNQPHRAGGKSKAANLNK